MRNMEELPFKNTEMQTEAVPELTLFKWMREGENEKEKAKRLGVYGLALALISFKRVMSP